MRIIEVWPELPPGRLVALLDGTTAVRAETMEEYARRCAVIRNIGESMAPCADHDDRILVCGRCGYLNVRSNPEERPV